MCVCVCNVLIVVVRRADIQDRYHFDTGIFCWIGLLSDETDPNSIFCTANIVIVKPHKRIKQHNVSVHYISSVLKPIHSLM